MDFSKFTPDDFFTMDLTVYAKDDLVEMAYFVWATYDDDEDMLAWRKAKLLPLVAIDHLDEDDGFDDED